MAKAFLCLKNFIKLELETCADGKMSVLCSLKS